MTVVHTYFYIVVDTQRGCRTLKLEVYVVVAVCGNSPEISVIVICLQKTRSALYCRVFVLTSLIKAQLLLSTT